MKTKKYAISLLVLLGIMFSSCETVQQVLNVRKPSANLKGLRFEDITLQSATLLFDVELENPYPVSLPLLDMDYAVTSGDNKLFSGKADIHTTIPAKDKKVVSLPMRISYIDLVRAFKGIRPGLKIPYEADAGLLVDTPALGQIRLPMRKMGELSVPTIPKIDEVDWKKILLDKATQR